MTGRKKEMKVLVKALNKFLKPISDDGTWKERKGKHLNISCKYKGCHIRLTFPYSPRPSGIANSYGMVRKALAHCGLSDQRFSVKMATSSSTLDEYLHKLYDVIEQEEETLYGAIYKEEVGTKSASRYVAEAKRKQRSVITKERPYKRKVSFVRLNKEITYTGYWVWKTMYRRDDKERTGYIRVTKEEYENAIARWKKRQVK